MLFNIGFVNLKIENPTVLDLLPKGFSDFSASAFTKTERPCLNFECFPIDAVQFQKFRDEDNSEQDWSKSIFNTTYYLDKDQIVFIKDYKNWTLRVLYVPNMFWSQIDDDNNIGYVKEKKILANLTYLCNQLLIAKKMIVLHGAGLIRNGGAYIFLAMDNGGKSTLINRNIDHPILSDDQIFYSFSGQIPYASATPFGKISHGPNSAKLSAFFYITKSNTFSIEPMESRGLVNSFWQDNLNDFLSMPRELRNQAFNLITDLAYSVPVFKINADHGKLDWNLIDRAVSFAQTKHTLEPDC